MTRKLLYFLCSVAVLTSCASQYNIQGTSNVCNLDGQMLYLKILKDNDMAKLDSCDVVHGHFTFTGALDTIKMASLYIDDESLLPVVLENGDITISIANARKKATGTPLNDRLYSFLDKYYQLQAQFDELEHQYMQTIMNGDDMSKVAQKLQNEYIEINQNIDTLVTNFIVNNSTNVLGPGVFMMITNMDVPELSPWVEVILSKADASFKQDPYVRWYVETARYIQNLGNGMEEMPQPMAMPAHGNCPPPKPEDLTR